MIKESNMPTRIDGIEERELIDLYSEQNLSIREIADYYNVDHSTVHNRMKEYGILSRSLSEAKIGNTNAQRCSINKDFFKTWTSQSAWLFGWSYGDGAYTNHYHLSFRLSLKDREVLEKMREILTSEHKISDNEEWNRKQQKYYSISTLQFPSQEIVKDLKNLSFYTIPQQYFSHALRGFFEAEGCVYWRKDRGLRKQGRIGSSISQNDRDLLLLIQQRLNEYKVTEGGSISPHGPGWELSFGVYDTIALYFFLYKNCDETYLKRKKAKFEELIKRQKGDTS